MREHPIPQDVVGYKFHIVGNMTLKQFAEVAIGVVIGVILYNTNLVDLVKWPLIILSAGIGVLVAFVPIEERPLDHWITTFFKRIYNPTKFYWKKETEIPFAFMHVKREKTKEEEDFEIDLTPARRQRIKEYLSSVGEKKAIDPLDTEEQQRMTSILEEYSKVEVKNITATPQQIKPNLTTKVRNLAKKSTISTENSEKIIFQQQQKTNQQLKQEDQQNQQGLTTAPQLTTPAVANEELKIDKQAFTLPNEAVATNKELPFPQQPTTPNTLVGMVLTPDNKLVDQATVQIKNNNGQVVYALKTNLLGQFSLSSALPNGTYVLTTQKTGFNFNDQTITLSGKIVAPLEIRSA
ncbi:MAG: carboxypeptidase regulatory-like domain-containing protein [Candidatus Pacebacteria bacterium]|nr:carboxypeptidase regulatory-like domain-containing protein [Candidatus Paceibacterota bacterium]